MTATELHLSTSLKPANKVIAPKPVNVVKASQETPHYPDSFTGEGFESRLKSSPNDNDTDLEEGRPFCPHRITDDAATPEHHLNLHFFLEGDGDYRTIKGGYYRHSESNVWEHCPDEEMRAVITEELKKLYLLKVEKNGEDLTFKEIHKFATSRNLDSAYKFNQSALALRKDEEFDSANLINFRNGVLDVRQNKLIPYDRDYFLTSQIQSDYKEGCECPEPFKRFVERCYGLEQMPYIRALIRYYVDFSLPFGYFLHVVGESGTGKGLLIRFIGSIHGDYYKPITEFHSLNTPEGRYQTLTGARVVANPDVTEAMGKMGAFYELVDNGAMTGRPLFSSSAPSRTWNVRFLFGSVGQISFERSSGGWDRRCLPLATKPRGDADPDDSIAESLEECKAEVISWAMAMPRDEVMKTLKHPEQFASSVIELRDAQSIASDSVKAFIDACLVPDVGNDSPIAKPTVYGWYKAFCDANKLSSKGYNKFCSEMKSSLGFRFEVGRSSKLENGIKVNTPSQFRMIALADSALFEPKPSLGDSSDSTKRAEYLCNIIKQSEGGLALFRDAFNQKVQEQETTAIQQSEPVQASRSSSTRHKWKAGDRVEQRQDGQWIDAGYVVSAPNLPDGTIGLTHTPTGQTVRISASSPDHRPIAVKTQPESSQSIKPGDAVQQLSTGAIGVVESVDSGHYFFIQFGQDLVTQSKEQIQPCKLTTEPPEYYWQKGDRVQRFIDGIWENGWILDSFVPENGWVRLAKQGKIIPVDWNSSEIKPCEEEIDAEQHEFF
ncbi:hypothetical protein C7B61_00305 [filamentous cyanobacterium CCP1]|nr:hypothetical protein C7B76_16755 [filamentous cyanobacterium CCP2]PSB68540.1 hypothetical protein C7B61_00305 [filamentous cyanobacterium CCP1]